ncbi:hypothetical protein GOD60_14130 [Sinorhizobium medicae]|nr:hypothetical protein [Sinorhizobium medicae]
MKQNFLDRLGNTVDAICASPRVTGYLIGYSSKGSARFTAYRPHGFQHFVILADGLSQKDALDLEEHLHMRIEADQAALSYQKYREKSRGRHHRSSGGITSEDGMNHSVYMAWWEEE